MSEYQYFSYTLTPQSRVSAGRGGEVRYLKQMHQIIRGSVIRGALGAAWWNKIDPGYSQLNSLDRQQVFDKLFSRNLHVRQAVPSKGSEEAVLQPVSAKLCKYQPEAECEDFIVDLALTATTPDKCEKCCGNLKDGKGWKVPSSWYTSVATTAITEDGTAEEQNLFSREVFKKDVSFTGTVRLDLADPNFDLVKEWLMTSRSLSIGGRKSVLGRVKWEAKERTAPDTPITPMVALQLQSSAILVDEMGFPTIDLKTWLETWLRNRAGAGNGNVQRTWIRPTTESGWNSIARMPKPTEWAIGAGSVALLQGWADDDLKALAQGIGLRQTEGFGEVRLLESEVKVDANGTDE